MTNSQRAMTRNRRFPRAFVLAMVLGLLVPFGQNLRAQTFEAPGGTGGASAEAGPVINSFTATPATVAPGQSTTLAWQVSNADAVRLSHVSGTLPASSFSVVVVPAATITRSSVKPRPFRAGDISEN
jgi:hypothetical protein